ncbi:hypothetical protein BJX99DRAFT_261026 [Aspergillus californicus]
MPSKSKSPNPLSFFPRTFFPFNTMLETPEIPAIGSLASGLAQGITGQLFITKGTVKELVHFDVLFFSGPEDGSRDPKEDGEKFQPATMDHLRKATKERDIKAHMVNYWGFCEDMETSKLFFGAGEVRIVMLDVEVALVDVARRADLDRLDLG